MIERGLTHRSSPEIPFSPIQSLRPDLCSRFIHSPLAALSRPLKSRMHRHNTAHPRLQTQLKQVSEADEMELDTPSTATESVASAGTEATLHPNFAPTKPKL